MSLQKRSIIFPQLKQKDGIDCTDLYDEIVDNVIRGRVNFSFYMMGLDFLFLLDKVSVDDRGGLHVH